MENNNYLSSGVNYIPLTVLDKQHTLFTTANGGAYDPLAFDDTNVGNNGRYCFGLADPSQFRFYNASTGEYNVAGIARAEEDSGIFINNTGERGIQVWLYFGDNYDQDEAVLSVGEGSDGYTDPDGGTIGYWQKYAYIRPHERATIPWIKDDEVGAQSNRMYFQYRNGNVSASSYEEWDGSGGTHNREWTYSTSSGYTYGSVDLVPLTYNNLIELEQNSFDAGLDAIAIRCMAVQGSLLLDSTPMDGRVDKDVLIKDTDSDVYVDNLRSGDIFDGKLWGPISSDYYEIDDLLYATPSGDPVTWGMTLERVISGDAQSRSHFLLNGLEIEPQSVIYNSATDQTTFSIQIAWPNEMYGGSEGVDIVSFEHYFARTEAEVVSGFVEGSYIAGATVEAKSKSGEMISTITDEFGYYEFNEPVVGTITAKGGYSTITGEIVDDNTSDDVISAGDLTTIQAPRKTHSNLGGIINSATSIMADLMDKQAMNKQEAISAFREAAVSLYDLETDVTDDILDQYVRVGLAGLQNSSQNDIPIFAKMTKLIKAVSEGEQSFADGGTSNNSSAKAKRKVANSYRKSLVEVIAKGASGKIVELANSYNTAVGGDSNLGSISNSEFNQNSKEDLIYLINAKAIEDVDSKITSTDKNLESKSAWKNTSKVLADSFVANKYDSIDVVRNMTYEEIFVHYNEKAMQRKQGARNLYNRKRQNSSISTSDFAGKLNNDSFRINITDNGYSVNGSITTSRGDSISKDDSVSVKYSNSNVSQRNAKISKNGEIISLNKGRDIIEVKDTTDVTTLLFGTGFAKGLYLIGNTTTLAYHNISQHEVIVNDEFFTKIGTTLWDGQDAAAWFSDSSFSDWYPDKVGLEEGDLYASTFKGKYKVIYGSNIRIKDENGNLRNWNIVDYRTGRSIVSPGSIEEFQLLEYIYEIFTHSNGLSDAPAGLYNIIKGAYDSSPFRDTDGDGVIDSRDAFPNDASETKDSDDDGVGDNTDDFPRDPSRSVARPMKMTVRVGDGSATRDDGSLSFTVNHTTDARAQSYTIEWGDGNTGDQDSNSHTYASAGDYQITIKGTYDPQYGTRSNDSGKIISIDQWGDYDHYLGGYGTGYGAFHHCYSMDVLAEDACIIHGTSMRNLFSHTDSLQNANSSLNLWDTSAITDMSYVFAGGSQFNGDISYWKTDNVTTMESMFQGRHYRGPYGQFNGDINTKVRPDGTLAWNTASLENISSMFRYQYAFQGSISNWNTDSLLRMTYFRIPYVGTILWPNNNMGTKEVTVGDQTYIAWDVRNVTHFNGAFGVSGGGTEANGISNWNISSNAGYLNYMFAGATTSDASWDLSTREVTVGNRTYTAWDTSNVIGMAYMFKSFGGGNDKLNGITSWDVSSVENLDNFAYENKTFNQDLSNWNTASLKSARFLVTQGRYGITPLDTSFAGWTISNIESGKGISGFRSGYGALSGISTENYDATLISFASQSIPSGISLEFGNSEYTPGGAAEEARQTLLDAGVTITDGGAAPLPFKFTTELPEGQTDFKIKPQMSGSEVKINWGDGNTEIITGPTVHTYSGQGPYEISIDPKYNGSTFEGFAGWEANYMTTTVNTILQWGDVEWENNGWFYLPQHCHPTFRLHVPAGAENAPDLSRVTSLANIFRGPAKGSTKFEDLYNNIETWDVSTITDMSYAFATSTTLATKSDGEANVLDLSAWDVSNVENFSGMFYGAGVTANGSYINPIGVNVTGWDTSSATNMSTMFRNKGIKTGYGNLNTSNVTNMESMFQYSDNLDEDFNTKMVDGILRWDVSKVTNFNSFMYNANLSSFSVNYFPSNWRLNPTADFSMGYSWRSLYFTPTTFTDEEAFATKTITQDWYGGSSYTAWDMSNCTNLSQAFFSFLSGHEYNPKIDTWNITSKMTNMSRIFGETSGYRAGMTGIDRDISGWDFSGLVANGFDYWCGNPNVGGYVNSQLTFSTENYDALLLSLDSQSLNITSLYMGASQHTPGGAAEAAKNSLIAKGITITDGGAAPVPSVQYDYGTRPSRDARGACSIETLDGTFYVAEEIGEEMPATLYSDAALSEAIDFSRSSDGYYTFQLNGSSTKRNFNLSRGRFGAVGDCR